MCPTCLLCVTWRSQPVLRRPTQAHDLAFWCVFCGLLPRFPQVLDGLRAVEKLLKWPTMRERFIAQCVGVDNAAAKSFKTWNCSLKSLRWESVLTFTQELLAIETDLRIYWNMEAYVGKMSRSRQYDQTEFGANVQAINKAIASASWWRGVAIVRDLCYTAEYIGSCAEGCECCEEKLLRGDPEKRQRTKWLSKAQDANTSSCPFKGCRAVELAAGDWLPQIQAVMSQGRARLTESIVKSHKVGSGC